MTILAGPDAVSAQVEAELAAGGTPVQRITGTVDRGRRGAGRAWESGEAF